MTISNVAPIDEVGFFSFTVGDGGRGLSSQITLNGTNGVRAGVQALFDFANYVDIGGDGGAFALDGTDVTQVATLVRPGVVQSEGTFAGPNGLITWTATTELAPGSFQLINRVEFSSDAPFGEIDFINYLDEDVFSVGDDILHAPGVPGSPEFQAFTLDGSQRIGFSQGGVYSTSDPRLVNANWLGWAADQYPELELLITGSGATYSEAGDIDTSDLPAINNPSLGQVFGPNDVTTAFAWGLDPAATSATVTTFLTINPDTEAFNRRPEAVDDAAATTLGGGVTVPVLDNDTDADGTIDASTVIVSSAPSRGTALVNPDGSISYTPSGASIGTDFFTYVVADNEGGISNRGTVVITISSTATDQPGGGVTAPTVPINPTTPTGPTGPTGPTVTAPSAPVDLTGPLVRDVFRFASGRNRTAFLVTFSEPMDQARASSLTNYLIVGEGRGGGRSIPLTSANYDPNSRSVKLFTNRRLDLSRRFRITLRGGPQSGLADARGRLLDGNGDGRAGDDFNGHVQRFGRV